MVTLVAQSATDAQLNINIRAVRSRLDYIRDKTGCRRAGLTRLALIANWSGPGPASRRQRRPGSTYG
jgi:hypothetical protein